MNVQRRQTPRVSLGPEHTVRFAAGGHAFEGIRLVNLSEGGCFLTVPRSDAGVFLSGTLLEQLRFEGPGLPPDALTGTVAFAMGASPGLSVVGVGVSFLQPPEDLRAALRRFVEVALGRG
jgi:hypothetical protein